MKISEVPIPGSFVIDLQPESDDRGFFARSLCVNVLEKYGANLNIVQQSISFNRFRNTLRGMHFQCAPDEEIKLVRVTRGSIYDVILDFRRNSDTYLQWYAVELSAENHLTLIVPKGVAHGFMTLEDNTEVFYQMTQPYVAQSSRGLRWNDPAFSIRWPAINPILSERDANIPLHSG